MLAMPKAFPEGKGGDGVESEEVNHGSGVRGKDRGKDGSEEGDGN